MEFRNSKHSKKSLLKKIVTIHGVYVPCFYEVSYKGNGEIKRITNLAHAPKKINIQILPNLNNYPCASIVPILDGYARIVVDRGCKHRCQFCHYAFIKRKYRFVSLNKIKKELDQLLRNRSIKTMGLTSAGSAVEYPGYEEISTYIKQKGLIISTGSCRADIKNKTLFDNILGYNDIFAFAVECSQRLRLLMRKYIKDTQIFSTLKLAIGCGVRKFRLYVILGLPQEKNEDIESLGKLIKQIYDLIERVGGVLYVHSTPFLPCPHTPLEREKQDDPFVAYQKLEKLKKAVFQPIMVRGSRTFRHYNDTCVQKVFFDDFEPASHLVKVILDRGDRRLSNFLLNLEELTLSSIVKALNDHGLDLDSYFRKIDQDRILPWSHIKND